MKLTKTKVLIGCMVILLIVLIHHFYRLSELNDHGVYTKAKVIDVKKSWIQKSRGSKYGTVWFEFSVNDSIIRIGQKMHDQKIEIGDCYWVYYSERNPNISNVLTDKRAICD